MKKRNSWATDAFIYHIFPLGLCGAPPSNDFSSKPVDRLLCLYEWTSHIQELGCNTIFLGPVFEASRHGYDTADYFTIDRRLGTNQTFRQLCDYWHQLGFRIILDGVFNHVGRDFWAFKDLLTHQEKSACKDWFVGIDFTKSSSYGDPFYYQGWNGYFDLAELNLSHPEVRAHLFSAVQMWIREFNIDGLRLDAADCVDKDFLKALSEECRRIKADFWLMGEVVEGDYREWANPLMLNSTTNYWFYGVLIETHNHRNYFEIADCLNRQYGPQGMFKDLQLYSFADNHDVDRAASKLRNISHLFVFYVFIFTLPGVPSIYYGSEWGIKGRRKGDDDSELRPFIKSVLPEGQHPRPKLCNQIQHLADIRKHYASLRYGSYREVLVTQHQIAYLRQWKSETILIVLNALARKVVLDIPIGNQNFSRATDILNKAGNYKVHNNQVRVTVPASGACILKFTSPLS